MKKIIPILVAALLIASSVKAEINLKNDTTLRFNSKIVQIQDSVGQIKIKVMDNDSTPYKQLYEGVFSDEKSYEKWTIAGEFGLQIPFLNKKLSRKKYSMESHWAGIGWGFANISDANYQLNNINGVSLKSEASNEFFFSVIEKTGPI